MSKVRIRFSRPVAVGVAVATAAGFGVVTGLGGVAGASGTGQTGASAPATLSGIQAKASAAITKRVDALQSGVAKVNAAKGLGSDQATLASYLGADIGPLQALQTKIAGDTSLQQARQDAATIFSGFRVYFLVLPAARLAGDTDRVTTTVLPRLTSAATKAQGYENATNQAQLQPLLTDLNAQISAATNATNGLAGTVLGYTPAEWNGNHELLSPAKSDVSTANAAVKKARQDVAQIVQVLRPGLAHGARAGAATTTTS